MKYWLISGLRDPRFESTLRANFERLQQANVEARIVVVETGSAVGCFEGALEEPKEGVVAFLRKALTYVRENAAPGDWFVRIDADDYYGPSYLEEIEKIRNTGADGTGIPSIYVKTEDSHLYFCESIREFRGACGGTLAGSVEKAKDFPDTGLPWGEDSEWVSQMQEAGNVILPRSSIDYSLVRWSGVIHTYPVPGNCLPHFWACKPYALGAWTPEKIATKHSGEGTPIEKDINRCFEGSDALKNVVRSKAVSAPILLTHSHVGIR